MKIGSRIRRVAVLAANAVNLVRFAGGIRSFFTHEVKSLLAGEWRQFISWTVTAVNFSQRDSAGRYRRWLRNLGPAKMPDGRVLVLLSAVGVKAGDLPEFLALVAASKHPCADLILLVARAEEVSAKRAAGRGHAAMQIIGVDDASPDTMVAVMRKYIGGSCSDTEVPETAYRYVSLLAPGCVPGDMPFSATGSDKVLIYGDEDAIGDDGRRCKPFFKPEFSPDLLLHADYLSACVTVTIELALVLPEGTIGDFHSLALMLVERAEDIRHVDAFVAHRYLAERKSAVPKHLGGFLRRRYGQSASVTLQDDRWTCHYGRRPHLTSVIIPTRDRIDLLAPCVDGIYGTNPAGTFEVIVVDNGSTQPETMQWLIDAQSRLPGFRVVPAPGAFNWSCLNNVGMEHSEGDVLVFLNNDTEPLHEDWLARLADVASRKDVGTVGALLLYPSGRIQHAGVVTGFNGLADHVYRGVYPDTDGHLFVAPTVPRNVAAVTGACLAVARDRMDVIGPFDEAYEVSGSDVELCIRAMRAGFVNVYAADVRLIHHEFQSRARRDPEADVRRLRQHVASLCPRDPYFNARLSLTSLYPSYAS